MKTNYGVALEEEKQLKACIVKQLYRVSEIYDQGKDETCWGGKS